ncbi:MAG: pyridoxamine 5'-phosphate oxidase family protein [Chloroflexi bacterium]|nr:pyridoxamine 5'-phosphate oxidase family protein [Chloroflexota bacterium]
MTIQFADEITTEDQLRAILGTPTGRAVDKVVTTLDRHCRAVIERSPFLLIASADSEGNMDVSPKGDPPGFVRILDDSTLAIPDRKGNRRADTFTNILQNPKIGLYFLVPGFKESLRVTGTARIVRDIELRESMAERGSVPELAIVVDVVDAFFHCAKCIIRSGLWESAQWADPTSIASFGQILADQTNAREPVSEVEEQLRESYARNLY